jgi:SAM-dependent methyltransferase
VADEPHLTSETFDDAFRLAEQSEWLRRVVSADLPPGVDPFSFITGDGLGEVAGVLAEARTGRILDLACGRGGPGLWIAQRIGADLVGVDFSAVGIEHARARAADLPDLKVCYVVADAASTGLQSESVDGVICIDAIQLMADRTAVMTEVVRLLRSGGTAVFTTWEDTERLSDLGALLEAVGLLRVRVEERPQWQLRERAIFERALADAPRFPDDGALQELAEEAETVLPRTSRRVIGIARKR